MMYKPCDVFSFFSGLGFLDLGFEDQGFNVEFVNEFHPPFLSAYKHARERLDYDLPKYGYLEGSIEKILEDPKRSKEFDSHLAKSRKQGNLVGFIGGPPCPDFSIAGKQKGALGSNGRLSRIYADLILAKKPDWFLFENVKGLWGTKKHRVFNLPLQAEVAGEVEMNSRFVWKSSRSLHQGFFSNREIDPSPLGPRKI